MEYIKKHLVVIVAILVPVIFLVVVALFVYVPNRSVKTDYDFVYMTCDGDMYAYKNIDCYGYMRSSYKVKEGKIVYTEPDIKSEFYVAKDTAVVRIFVHNTEINESREIALEDAVKLKLNSLSVSPDGVSIRGESDRSGDFLILGGGSNYGHYLIKGDNREKLNIISNNDYYGREINLLGWVLPPRVNSK